MRLTWADIICECGGGGGWGCWGDGCDEGCVGGDGRIVELFCNKQRKRQTCSNTAIQATARLEGLGIDVLSTNKKKESFQNITRSTLAKVIKKKKFIFLFFSLTLPLTNSPRIPILCYIQITIYTESGKWENYQHLFIMKRKGN